MLLHLCRLLLRRVLLLLLLLGHVTTDEATADCSHHRVMSRVVTGHSADRCTFQAAFGLCCTCRSYGRKCEQRYGQQNFFTI